MNFNRFLSSSFLPVVEQNWAAGEIYSDQKRRTINQILTYLSFFCVFKIIILLIVPWNMGEYILYIQEMYVYNSEILKGFYITLMTLHFATGYAFYYWRNYINSSSKNMKCLNFLLICDFNALSQHYDLDVDPTRRFIERANKYTVMFQLMVFKFDILFFLFCSRCLIISYFEVNPYYFYMMCIPLFLITLVGYHCMSHVTMSMIALYIITVDFIRLRIRSVSKRIMKSLDAVAASEQREPAANFKEESIEICEEEIIIDFLDENENERIVQAIGDIICQFHDSNLILDNLLSYTVVIVLFGGFSYPFLIFFPFPVLFKVLAMLMYISGLFIICYSVATVNEFFLRDVKRLTDAIHHAMPLIEETEWISALKKHGIIENTEEKEKEQLDRMQVVDKNAEFDKKLTEQDGDIDALFDELNDEDERAFEEHRLKRLANIRAEYDRKKFGSVMEITKQNYVDEVNNAGEDVWVVVHVYKPGMMLCNLINQFLNNLAIRFKTTKFVKSIVDLCIPNFPETNLPALFIYHNGNVKQKLLGESQIGNLNMKCEDLEWILHKIGAIESSLESDPRLKNEKKKSKTFFTVTNDSDTD